MQLIGAHIFEGQLVRRPPKMQAEVLDRTDVGLLGVHRHVADRHVVDHALPEWRHFLRHGILLSDELHERAIFSNRMRSCHGTSPALVKCKGRKKVIFRRLRNGSVEPYSLSSALTESLNLILEWMRQ